MIDLTAHFRIKTLVCINKHDINPDNVRKIEEICGKRSVGLAGKISYDNVMNKAMRSEKTINEYDPGSKIAQEIEKIWNKIESGL